jgi:hypothetical protein
MTPYHHNDHTQLETTTITTTTTTNDSVIFYGVNSNLYSLLVIIETNISK